MSTNGNGSTKARFGPVQVCAADGRVIDVYPLPDTVLDLGPGRSTRRAWAWQARRGGRPTGEGNVETGMERCKAIAAATRAAGPGASVRYSA